MEHARAFLRKTEGHALDGDSRWAGRGDFHGLLDHGFSRGPARARGQGFAFRKDGADYRVVLQDGCAADRDTSRLDRLGGASGKTRSRERVAAWPAQLQRRAATNAGSLFRARTDGT